MGQESVEAPVRGQPEIEQIERLSDARDAAAAEHNLTFSQAVKLYPYGIFWSVVMSTSVVMEGYDTKLMPTLFAQPSFQKHFGRPVHGKAGKFEISAPWQSGLSNGSTCGQLGGLLLAGYLSERYGFRKTMIGGLASMIGFIFIMFFASDLKTLQVGSILMGFPLGLFQTTTVIYALEVAPLRLRAYLTAYVHLNWSFGQVIASGTLRGFLHREDQWAYRIPFALQWMWPFILIPLYFFAPESPWWLVRRDRPQEAKKMLARLTTRSVNFDMDKQIALMQLTTEHERILDAKASYASCFKGTDLRRTLIVIAIYCIQTLNGNPLRGYSTYFFQQAGLATTWAFNMTLIGYSVAIVGNVTSWFLIPLAGRRILYLSGLGVNFSILIIIGALGVPQAKHPESGFGWAIGSILVISQFTYCCTVGPLTNTLCSEIPSAILRSKSVALARWGYAVTTIVAGVLTPYMLNPTAWDWKAKTGFFWAGACLISLIFSFFCVPEPKDRTTAEMDVLFERKTNARQFSKTAVDIAEVVVGEDLVKQP